eukprot:scaffold6685_cov129-Isochrysis_galbana.AAC.1
MPVALTRRAASPTSIYRSQPTALYIEACPCPLSLSGPSCRPPRRIGPACWPPPHLGLEQACPRLSTFSPTLDLNRPALGACPRRSTFSPTLDLHRPDLGILLLVLPWTSTGLP